MAAESQTVEAKQIVRCNLRIIFVCLCIVSNDLDLATLAQRDLLREGDIITYKRHFPFLSIEVEKELLVRHLHGIFLGSLTHSGTGQVCQ